jgi:hypothetical protein
MRQLGEKTDIAVFWKHTEEKKICRSGLTNGLAVSQPINTSLPAAAGPMRAQLPQRREQKVTTIREFLFEEERKETFALTTFHLILPGNLFRSSSNCTQAFSPNGDSSQTLLRGLIELGQLLVPFRGFPRLARGFVELHEVLKIPSGSVHRWREFCPRATMIV